MGFLSDIGNAVGGVVKDPIGTVGNIFNNPTESIIGGVLTGGLGTPFAANAAAKKQAEAQAAAQAAGQRSQALFPDQPTFQNLGTLGDLPQNFQVSPNFEGFDAIKKAAFGTGPSDFAQQLVEQQKSRTTSALGNLGQQSQGALSNTKNALAATSGVSGAVSDKLNQAADRQTLFARQNIRNQGNAATEAILGQDANQRQGFLNAFPALEQQALGPRKFNIQNAINDKTVQDQFNLGVQDTNQKMAAAQFQAEAIRNSGSEGILGSLGSFFGL